MCYFPSEHLCSRPLNAEGVKKMREVFMTTGVHTETEKNHMLVVQCAECDKAPHYFVIDGNHRLAAVNDLEKYVIPTLI